MKTLRTPDENFENLPGYEFSPNYAEVTTGGLDPLRVHFLDEGDREAPPVLLMHGEPTWSYLYRHMIPPLIEAGYRCIAPDLVGFGRSDKPTEMSDYTYARMVGWMQDLLFNHLDLRNITYFGQDWGALVGLRLVASDPNRYDRVAIGNGGLPTGAGKPSDAFMSWQRYSRESPTFHIGKIVGGGCTSELTESELAAYDAPFPNDTYQAGARILPSLVPTSTDDPAHRDNVAAWTVLSQFEKPFLCCFSDSDPVTRGGDVPFKERIPGAQGQAHTTITGAGHFLQEDASQQLAQVLIDFIVRTSS